MEKRLKELLEIAKNGTKEDVLAYLPNLEIESFKYHVRCGDEHIASVYNLVKIFLKENKSETWENNVQLNFIEKMEELAAYQELGLVVGVFSHKKWQDFPVNPSYFFENKKIEIQNEIILNDYLDKIKNSELKVKKSPFSNSYYILKNDEKISWNHKPENSLRIADHWNFVSKNELHCKVSEYNQPINSLMIGVYNSESYQIGEIDEAKIKGFIEEIQEYVTYD